MTFDDEYPLKGINRSTGRKTFHMVFNNHIFFVNLFGLPIKNNSKKKNFFSEVLYSFDCYELLNTYMDVN